MDINGIDLAQTAYVFDVAALGLIDTYIGPGPSLRILVVRYMFALAIEHFEHGVALLCSHGTADLADIQALGQFGDAGEELLSVDVEVNTPVVVQNIIALGVANGKGFGLGFGCLCKLAEQMLS